MSKKTIIIISATIGLLLVIVLAYYFLAKNNPGGSGPTDIFRKFFPFGGDNPPPITTGEEPPPPQPTPNPEPNFTQKLRKLSAEPVAGAGTLDIKAGTVVRYIEKATGHIFEVELFSPKQGRISNTTIPTVYDAVWGNKNNSLIARYLKEDNQTIDTYSLTVKETSTTTENTITGLAFPLNLDQISVFGDSVFYLGTDKASSFGYVSKFDGSSKKQIWNSPVKGLLSQYVNAKTVALTTKPGTNVGGFLYLVDTGTGQIRKILGDVPGLSTLVNASTTQVLYLRQTNRAQMFLFDVKNNSSVEVTPVTFPEKCVWSKKNTSIIYCAVPRTFIENNTLTSWYKGFVLFTDDIWKYDLKNNTASLMENIAVESGEEIDVIKPMLSEGEQYLIFMNKKDNALWSLDISTSLSVSTSTQQ